MLFWHLGYTGKFNHFLNDTLFYAFHGVANGYIRSILACQGVRLIYCTSIGVGYVWPLNKVLRMDIQERL